jgi:hypothetical protein
LPVTGLADDQHGRARVGSLADERFAARRMGRLAPTIGRLGSGLWSPTA